ncbi:MAG: hypothetical protein NTZ24_12545 [Deltaproteobacteria bacterium]|nr:hypothetical protein [Deltaproteobacteria bacterium]
MKNFKKIALIAFALLIIPACAFGWSYRFVNNSPYTLVVHVFGEHLFWQQEDGTATINANSSAVINMPGGICGTYFTYDTYFQAGTDRHVTYSSGIASGFKGAACWNLEIVLSYVQAQNNFTLSYNKF